jgi:hypothetical protein
MGEEYSTQVMGLEVVRRMEERSSAGKGIRLRWGYIASICEEVAEKLDLEFTGFSGPYYCERYYAHFKKKDSDNEIRARVVEVVADSEVIKIRIAAESYIEEQLREKLVSGEEVRG